MSNLVPAPRLASAFDTLVGEAHSPAEDDFGGVSVWPRLVAGRLRVSASYCTPTHCCLELEVTGDGHSPLPEDVATLERILEGTPQKVIALESGVAVSTVGCRAGRCLRAFGLNRRVSAVPASLVMLLHVYRRRLPVAENEVSAGERAEHGRILLRLPRPDLNLKGLFSPAECEVIRLLIEGNTQLAMAKHRNTSLRTIANQVCAVYLKARTSGRLALINSLIALEEAPRDGGDRHPLSLLGENYVMEGTVSTTVPEGIAIQTAMVRHGRTHPDAAARPTESLSLGSESEP